MPSLRKRVSTYFRQLSFHNEPRQKKHNMNENAFITKYLQGHICMKDGPPVIYGKNPTDLPNYELARYETGYESIISCYSGPYGGLTTVKRVEKHLSIPDADDFDFIDTQVENGTTAAATDTKLPQEWNRKSEYVFGISDSLYDTNLVTKIKNGDPIADCFGVISRKDSVMLAVADGVNWGEKACIAAKSAVHGCLHYLNKTIFNDTKLFENLVVQSDQQGTSATTSEPLTHISNTREVFVCLLRAFNCAHDLILENNGMLTTLTVAIVLPLRQGSRSPREGEEYVCCVCNVGDTLAYIYSGEYGIRELTKGSHDITSNRDMRDALGALGPVDGINPELSNLTLSVTTLSKGDIVMVASDGLTDNFDPSVCRFTVNTTKVNIADNKEMKSKKPTSDKQPPSVARVQPPNCPVKPPRRSQLNREDRACSEDSKTSSKSEDPSTANTDHKPPEGPSKEENPMDNPLIAHFMKQNSVDETDRLSKESSPARSINSEKQTSSHASSNQPLRSPQARATTSRKPQQNYNFLRSKTTIDFHHSAAKKPILRNEDGIPYVTPLQRYELQLLLMEDILKRGISGQEAQCTTSKRLCENLVNFTVSITAAKRRTLEDMDLYFDNRDGVSVEISPIEKKQRRKKGLERVQNLPGKLDHVTVVACNVAHSPVNVHLN